VELGYKCEILTKLQKHNVSIDYNNISIEIIDNFSSNNSDSNPVISDNSSSDGGNRNISNIIEKRKRSNFLSLINSKDDISEVKKVKSDNANNSEISGENIQHYAIDTFIFDYECYIIDIPLYGTLEINLYFIFLSFLFDLYLLLIYNTFFI